MLSQRSLGHASHLRQNLGLPLETAYFRVIFPSLIVAHPMHFKVFQVQAFLLKFVREPIGSLILTCFDIRRQIKVVVIGVRSVTRSVVKFIVIEWFRGVSLHSIISCILCRQYILNFVESLHVLDVALVIHLHPVRYRRTKPYFEVFIA